MQNDAEYQWIINDQDLNLMEEKTVYSPENFGMNKIFYLKITCIHDKLELYLCLSDNLFWNGFIKPVRISTIKVILLPFDESNKRKVWKARDIELDGNSSLLSNRYKLWKFNKKQMIGYFSNHSLLVQLKGIYYWT